MDDIHVEHLFFAYQGNPVLKDVSFTIPKGDFVGIIGPNGGGKTTLLHLLMGFLRPDKGSIKILGKQPKEARHFIGWVPQNFHYDRQFPISVLEVVLGGRLHHTNWLGRYQKEDVQKALEALEKVEMLRSQKDRFAELSGGQAQRVLLARALAGDPKILFLDEATAHVDLQAQKDIYRLLKSFEGTMTILMVTHDLKAAVDYVKRVFCVEGGLAAMTKDTVCSHYALGLYHPPLTGRSET